MLIEQRAAEMRAHCDARDIPVSWDGCVDRPTAAMLCCVEIGTIDWWASDARLHRKRRGLGLPLIELAAIDVDRA
jgi:hypothetical protein